MKLLIGFISGIILLIGAIVLLLSDNSDVSKSSTQAIPEPVPIDIETVETHESAVATIDTDDELQPAQQHSNQEQTQSIKSKTCVNFEQEDDPILIDEFKKFVGDIGINIIGAYNEYAYYDESALLTMAQGGDKRAMYSLGLYYAWYPDYHARMINDFSLAQEQTLTEDMSPVERLNKAEYWLMKAAHEGFVTAFTELEFVARDRQIYELNTPQDGVLQPEIKEKPAIPPYANFAHDVSPDYSALGLGIFTPFSVKKDLSDEEKALLSKLRQDWKKERARMGRDNQLKLNPSEGVRKLLVRLKEYGECKIQK